MMIGFFCNHLQDNHKVGKLSHHTIPISLYLPRLHLVNAEPLCFRGPLSYLGAFLSNARKQVFNSIHRYFLLSLGWVGRAAKTPKSFSLMCTFAARPPFFTLSM